jgi:hypothetical protein
MKTKRQILSEKRTKLNHKLLIAKENLYTFSDEERPFTKEEYKNAVIEYRELIKRCEDLDIRISLEILKSKNLLTPEEALELEIEIINDIEEENK